MLYRFPMILYFMGKLGNFPLFLPSFVGLPPFVPPFTGD